MELTNDIKEQIKNHALSDLNNEVCGFVLFNGKVVPCINRASDSPTHFIIAAGDVKKVKKKGEIAAVYHSHIPGDYVGDNLSQEDFVISEYFNVRSILYSVKDDKFFDYCPSGKPVEYVGRPYIRGVLDEFHLLKDYYQRELNIEVKQLKNKSPDGFLSGNGFMEVGGLQKHDVLVINYAGDPSLVTLGLYLDHDKLLIHPQFKLSAIVGYNYGLKKWTKKIFRYHKL